MITRQKPDIEVIVPKLTVIEAQCAAKGMRMTEQRRIIARVLAETNQRATIVPRPHPTLVTRRVLWGVWVLTTLADIPGVGVVDHLDRVLHGQGWRGLLGLRRGLGLLRRGCRCRLRSQFIATL